MREIKFRVYKKETGIMYYPETTQEQFNHYFQIGSGGFWLYDKEGKLLCTSNWGDVLMQFTGMKDKNGKEIYEGDIIQSTTMSDEVRISIVAWKDMKAKFEGLPYDAEGKWMNNGIYRDADLFYMFEIIGNIHDNPELLNPPAVSPALNTMNNNFDPGTKQEEVTTGEVAAQESASQDAAMEVNSEEGTTEG